MEKPGLYGITNSNRDYSDPYYWGKNQFNSSFPIALACYMRDTGLPAVYLSIDKNRKIQQKEIDISTLFNTNRPNSELFFSFESRYEPFKSFVHDELETIDCVVKEHNSEKYLRPIEIKLTTLPDNTTANLEEDKYGCEIVIRSATMRYMALSMGESLKKKFSEIRKIFEKPCVTIRNWDNADEIQNRLPDILESLEEFVTKYRRYEKPLLMQPIWKTKGKSAELAENCLDIFIWSDFALTRLFMDSALSNKGTKISRQQRAAVRLARFLFELGRSGTVYQEPIYDGMTLGHQNDKEFAISGNKTHNFMKCNRLTKPKINKDKIKEIILGGGQKYLSPERRFDAIIYFSTDLFE